MGPVSRSLRFVALAAGLVSLVGATPEPLHSAQAVVRTADPAKRGLPESAFPRVQRLAEGVYSYEQLRSAGTERFTTVSLFVVGPSGVLVADGQGSVAETRRLLDTIRTITPLPVTHVVIGSDHGDHTAGNSEFPATATVYVHPTSQAALASAGGRATTPPDPARRTVLVPDRESIRLGAREIQVVFLGRAHTGGDLSVLLPRERILFMSEAYLNRVFPAMRSAFPTEWVRAIERAQALPVDTFVPGHGFVESPAILKEELETFRQALLGVIGEARRLHQAKLDVETAVRDARFGELESWSLRQSQGATAIRRVYLELDGKLPR
jgi:glyoxylase-like metal-dependent hydrolase (beta-lactamase superfamily II)